MIDLLYIAGTIAFFGAMLAYVRGCRILGREDTSVTRGKSER